MQRRRGAHVLLLCRSLERGEKAAQEIREATKGEVTVFRWVAVIIKVVVAWNFKMSYE